MPRAWKEENNSSKTISNILKPAIKKYAKQMMNTNQGKTMPLTISISHLKWILQRLLILTLDLKIITSQLLVKFHQVQSLSIA